MKSTLDEGRDRKVWEGWFEKAKECRFDDGSLKNLLDHIANDYNLDYGTQAKATAAVAFAAASAFANEARLTHFQWEAASMDLLGRMMCPFNKLGYEFLDYDDLMYPQYEYRFTERKISAAGAKKLKEEAQKMLDKDGGYYAAPYVRDWWKKLARGEFPSWLIVKG